MAEGGAPNPGKNTLPQRGKVQKVKQEFMVHEDAGFAYQLQSEEIDKHYGLNRYNRRTVREDIPIAKVVQSDEEHRQQQERFQQLQALRAQAEEDERVAKGLMQEELIHNQAQKIALELTDEEYAKNVQEIEKKKYEKYIEKKKQRKLKKEREEIERTQQQRSEEARLAMPLSSGGSSEDLDNSMNDLQVTGAGGQAMSTASNLCLLLQKEQNVKGGEGPSGKQAVGINNGTRVTPGGRIEDEGDFSDFYNLPNNVDPAHRQFLQEIQDEELAKLIQEQEHKRSKAQIDKTKLKEIEDEDRRLAQIIQEQEKLKLRKAKQKKKQQLEERRLQEATQKPPALPPRNNEHNHRKYRRNSFIMSMENGQEDTNQGQSDSRNGEYLIPAEQRQSDLQRVRPSQADSQRVRPSQADSQRVRPSLESINRSASVPAGDGVQHSRQFDNRTNMSQSERARKQNIKPEQLPVQNVPDVERWLAGQNQSSLGRLRSDRSDSDHYPDSPSPGSYHSEESFPHRDTSIRSEEGSHYAVSDPFNFNIATAIDPTFTPRWQDTERRPPGQPSSRPPPTDERTINTSSSREDSYHEDMPAVVNPYGPVQGQRRVGTEKSKKSSKKQGNQDLRNSGQKDKGNCKQQ